MTGATDALRPRAAAGLRVWTGGSGGLAVVLLHGLGGSAANWVEVVPRLVPQRAVVAVDLPGHGGSPAPPPPAGIDRYADAVGAALDDLGVASAHVAGHSFGGHVAARLALRRPDLVGGLLLVCPSGISSRRRLARVVLAGTTRLRPTRAVRPLALRLAGRAWFRRALFTPWVAGNAEHLPARAVRGLVWDARRHADVRSPLRAMADDPRLWLGAVRCPALVLWGARDVQLPVEDAFEIARRLRAPLRVVAGCGHLVIVERPDVVVDALDALARRTSA